MLISKDLYLFLKDYMNWIEEGAVNYEPYYRATGLCGSILECEIPNLNLRKLESELDYIFESEGLDTLYPFGEHNYETRFHNRTQHLDSIRLEWIKDHIEEYENALVTT